MKLQTYLVLLTPLLLLNPAAARAVPTNPDAVAYQIDAAHDGSVTFQDFSATPARLWSVDLGNLVSYPLIAQGEVYVTSVRSSPPGVNLDALNARTGHVDWNVPLSPSDALLSAAYDNDKVFVINSNRIGTTRMNAYNAATGALLWSQALVGQFAFSSPPTARNGIVYTGGAGSGGTMYALRETDGATLWTTTFGDGGDHSSPAVTPDGVYVSYTGPQTYKFNPTTGGLLWHFAGNGFGGGGTTPVYYNGNLYDRGIFVSPVGNNQNMLLLNGTTGQPSTAFSDASFTNSPTAPAFLNGKGYITAGNGLLEEFDASSGAVGWSKSSAGDPFVTAPIIINGVVFDGTSSGKVYEFDGIAGGLLGMINVGSGINGPNEVQNRALIGLEAGDGLLVVPAGNTINAYSVVTTPEPSSAILALTGPVLMVGLLAWRRNRSRLRRAAAP